MTKGHYPELSGQVLNAITCILPNEKKVKGDLTHRKGDGTMSTEAETGVMPLQAKESWPPSEDGRTRNKFCPRAFEGSRALPTPWFQFKETDFRHLASETVRE